MPTKIFAAAVAMVMMLSFLAPQVIKLKDIALGVIMLIGVVMMLVDLWQSLKSEKD